MDLIRVVVVDDAAVIRKILSDSLNSEPGLEVVGLAANGRIALRKIAEQKPDVVTLDVEMPEMDGLETIAEIRKVDRQLPVIMFSAATERGAEITLQALALGATDWATKPSKLGSLSEAVAHVKAELVPKIKAVCGADSSGALSRREVPEVPIPEPRPRRKLRPERPGILAIGVSTGGPAALQKVLPELPENFPIPIVIVQHMPPVFTSRLAQQLDGRCRIRVEEAVAGAVLEPGKAWVAPGDYHLVLEPGNGPVRLRLSQDPPENSCRPSVDVLFRSVAKTYGAASLAVVLTGMGKDGLEGSEHIHEAGGRILAQDQATSVVWGMPGFVAQEGLAEEVLPLERIGDKILQCVPWSGAFRGKAIERQR